MNKNLDAEISAVDVVAKEEIASLVWRSADFKQFHEVKELSVHVAAHCNTTTSHIHQLVLTLYTRFPPTLFASAPRDKYLIARLWLPQKFPALCSQSLINFDLLHYQ